MNIYQKLHAAIDDTVKHYRSDMERDRAAIGHNPTTPFLHFARETGTHLAFLHPADSELWPLPGEQVSFLMGRAGRHHILRSMAEAIPTMIQGAAIIHYFDGRRLRKVDPLAAGDIGQAWRRSVETAWRRPCPELAATISQRAMERTQ